ncbi:MAG: Fic family protein [Halomonadaceae bacterium]|nr:MAG: Fic family protein [Halomonadaceae bacterium]
MQIISGAIGKEVIHYEGPPSDRVPEEMARFLRWFNEESLELPGIARAAIAHLWFETIHPYEDGNGRVGRTIADKALSQSLAAPFLLSTGTVFSLTRKQYYENLNKASKNTLDATPWVNWFGACAVKTQDLTMDIIKTVAEKARFYDRIDKTDLNDRQLKALRLMIDAEPQGFEGGMNATKYKNITRCSKSTATRDLSELVEKNMLKPVYSHGRYARYELNGFGS